jgi:molybdopterin-biosynthesis enzyme MoeA-like protein
MQAMFDGIKHRLTGGRVVLSVAVAAYIPEGVMAEKLDRLQGTYTDIEIGSYPFVRDGRLGVSVVLRGAEAGRLDAAADDLRALIRSLGAEPVEDRKT